MKETILVSDDQRSVGAVAVSRRGHQAWILSALGLLALGLRWHHLTHFELWIDEAATWYFARLAVSGGLFEQLALEPTPPFYFLLVGAAMRLFGESDFVLRLPSLLLGVAAVPAVFALAAHGFPQLLGRRVGYLAAGLVAVHPLHVFYSQEARVYPLLLLKSLLLWLCLRVALRKDQKRWWTAFGAVLLIACYSHFFGLFLGTTAGLMILLWSPTPRTRWRGLAACALVGLALAPYLAYALPRLDQSAVAGWVGVLYERFPAEKRFGRTLEMGLFGAGYGPFLRQISRPETPPLLRWTSLLVQAGLLYLAFLRVRRLGRGSAFGFLLLAWLLPLLIPWTLNHWRAFFHPGRHDFYVVGTVCLLLAAGLDELLHRCQNLPNRWRHTLLAAFVGLTLLAAVGQRLVALHQQPPTSQHSRAGAWLSQRAVPGDRVLALGLRRLVTEHYFALHGNLHDIPTKSFPGSTDNHPGWIDANALLEDQPALYREARERLATLARTLPMDATLYVLERSYPRTKNAVSTDWLVDRHLLRGLADTGWRRVDESKNQDLGISAYHPPQGGP